MLKDLLTINGGKKRIGRLVFAKYVLMLLVFLGLILASVFYIIVNGEVTPEVTIQTDLLTGAVTENYSFSLPTDTPLQIAYATFIVLSTFMCLWAMLCLQIKRLRDLGAPAPIFFVGIIPYINLLYFLYLFVWPGDNSDEPELTSQNYN
jgi:uncharacterized membrane protein YhaH (DUF805 family)